MRQCAGPNCDEEFQPNTHNHRFCTSQCKRDAENASRRRLVSDVVAAVAPAYQLDDQQELIEFLRSENRRLARAAEKYKNIRHEVVTAVLEAARENFSQIEMEPVPKPKSRSTSGHEEVAAIGVADWQLGKVTSSYNVAVLEERVEEYAERVIDITNVQRSDHPVREAHLWVVGDLLEGEDIFPGQAHLIERSLYAQVAKDGPRILSNFIRRLLVEFDRIKFIGVIGNHGHIGGRSRKEYNDETNMDRMLYKICEHIFANEPRVEFVIPDGNGERSFWAVDQIGQHGTLLVHGDQFPAPNATHAYMKKILSWRNGGIPVSFDDVFMGHWHHNTKFSFGDTVVRVSGSPESDNTFAQEFVGHMSRPSQHLQFVHPQRGVTAEYDVWLS